MNNNKIKQIISAGIAAPSADNSQPWRYSQNGSTIYLYVDEHRSGKLSDTRYLLTDIALGCAVENMKIQACHLDLGSNITHHLEGQDDFSRPILSIEFFEKSIVDSIPASTIFQRHTDRSFPWKGPITSQTKNEISQEIQQVDGARLIWLTKTQKKKAYKALRLAESLRFSDKNFHHELFSSIDFSLNWRQPSTEHIAPGSLNIEFFAKPIFKLAKKWSVMKILNWLGFATVFGTRSTVIPSLLSPELCFVCIKTTDRESIINTGRAIERTWLKATEKGLNIHPLASPGIMSLNFFQHPDKKIKAIQSLIQEIAGEDDHGILFLRMGYSAKKSTPLSLRREIESFQQEIK